MSNNFRRFNILTEEWIIVAVNRINRPWQPEKGVKDLKEEPKAPMAQNPLAPGALRTSGRKNDGYLETYVFDNDFPSFTEFEKCAAEEINSDLYKQQEVRGTCKVICYHPNSDLTLATMPVESVRKVVQLWTELYLDLGSKYTWVQIFENRGAIVGCSNAHPHGQVWASDYLPTIPEKMMKSQKKFHEKHQKSMLLSYLDSEVAEKTRIVFRTQFWTVLVPFWAFWPYEIMILPNRKCSKFVDLSAAEKLELAEVVQKLLIKYDNIFECSFPYMMGWMSAPENEPGAEHFWQLHCSFYPPLLRSSKIPKFLAGYEVFAEKQRDISPEIAAETLRNMQDVHYTKKKKRSLI
ncbi:unnamed protein product [Caenorhabditis angaria]|uniref:Galactose-1-phosphate uridylyltransferase n=1 Tax=Caenorhabditis angaria TaxID=860376 RepID=A0A9P1IGU5_9PELO|nr:unnamed protein product [Caenorhabditis angaria]